jgi:beta-galactosidase
VKAMIERDRNRPSIILWGVRINESPDHTELYQRTNMLAHELDPTRQTGGVRDFLESEFLEDVFTYNDFSNSVLDPIHQPYLITEFGGHMFPTKSWDHEERRIQHALLHAKVQNLQIGCNKVAGAIGWCAFDYNTHREFGSGDRICHHGVMDIFRLPKWVAYFYRSQLPPEQAVILQAATHWTMGDRAGGGNNPLTVFSNCDEIEVFIGVSCMGRYQPDRVTYKYLTHPPFTIQWPEDFNPWGQAFDDLRIVGYLGEEAVAEQRIASDHEAHALKLAIDTPQLQADGADMTRLTVKIIDRFGNILPYAAHVIQFELEGDATLVGENPLPLLGGQAALYVRSGQQIGSVQITASTPGLPSASVTLIIDNSNLSDFDKEKYL